MNSVIGKAKRSVDSTVDAYMGRAAFAACILAAVVFALAGVWIALVERYGTLVSCFALAGILVIVSLIIHATVVASENKAKRDIEDVEKSLEKTGMGAVSAMSALPFDLSTAITILPLITPLLRSVRSLLPYILVAGLVASYIMSRPSSASDAVGEPVQA